MNDSHPTPGETTAAILRSIYEENVARFRAEAASRGITVHQLAVAAILGGLQVSVCEQLNCPLRERG